MSTRTVQSRIQLRRDTEANYALVKDTFIPLKGEVLLVDMTSGELRSKVGDGVNTFGQLQYSDQVLRDMIGDIVVQGYYYNGKFYLDETHLVLLGAYDYKIYIDLASYDIYGYIMETAAYQKLVNIPTATSATAGVMKLYSATGSNTDGTMTQSAITAEIGKKITASVDEADECLIFTAGV